MFWSPPSMQRGFDESDQGAKCYACSGESQCTEEPCLSRRPAAFAVAISSREPNLESRAATADSTAQFQAEGRSAVDEPNREVDHLGAHIRRARRT